MELPKNKSGISKRWCDQKFLMIGDSGIGKSEFFSHAERPFYLEAEPGLNFLDVYKLPCRDWDDIGQTMSLLIKEAEKPESFPYDLIVVDTIDKVVDYASEETIRWGKNKFKNSDIVSIGDIGQGTGWDMRRTMVHKVLNALEKFPCAVAIIGHLDCKEVDESGQVPYHKHTISIGGKVGSDILAWSDHTLHVKGVMLGDVLKRTVYTKPTKSREAKSRGGIIKDGWVWSENSAENFNKLREQFN